MLASCRISLQLREVGEVIDKDCNAPIIAMVMISSIIANIRSLAEEALSTLKFTINFHEFDLVANVDQE